MAKTGIGNSIDSFVAYAHSAINDIDSLIKTATGALKQQLDELNLKLKTYVDSISEAKAAKKAAAQAKAEAQAKAKAEARRAQQAQRQANRQFAEQLNLDELAREAGNGGRSYDPNYVRNSKECRAHLLDAIDDGTYTASVESYMETINEAHRIPIAALIDNMIITKDCIRTNIAMAQK